MKTLFLCGFMGCGKSLTGKILSKRLKRRFTDLDAYIVAREKRSIPEIFAADGEAGFRRTEAECMRELSGNGAIVATGGGALISEENAHVAAEKGFSVYIATDFDICYNRIKGDRNRPLVQSKTEQELRELYIQRDKIYRAHATYTVNGNAGAMVLVRELEKFIRFEERRSDADL